MTGGGNCFKAFSFRPRAGLLVAVFSSGLVLSLSAAEAVKEVRHKPLVVTAGAVPVERSYTPGSIAVIESAYISGIDVTGISDLMDIIPGAWRQADGAWGADVNIRGLTRESVVMLVDGCRVNTATDIGARFGFMHPLDIERIEILKGPISARYGSGSIGGVVNIVTKGGAFSDKPAWHGGLSSGGRSNPGGLDGFGFLNFNSPDLHFYLSHGSRNFSSYADGNGDKVVNSQFEDSSTRLRTGLKMADFWETVLELQHFAGKEVGIPGTGAAPLPGSANVTYPETCRSLVSLKNFYRPQGDLLQEISLNVYYQLVEREVRIDRLPPASQVVGIRPEADHKTAGTKLVAALSAGDHSFLAGLDAWRRRMSSDRRRIFRSGNVIKEKPLPESGIMSSGVFVEHDWVFSEALRINTGARLDGIEVENDADPRWGKRTEHDSSWNMHAGTSLRVTENLTLKAIAAGGYRAPELEERYQYLDLAGGMVKLGDPDLDSETSRFAELGVNWQSPVLHLGAAVFVNDLDDLIGERIADESTIVNDNVDEARIHGFELEGSHRLSEGLTLFGNIAHLTGRDTKNSEDLANIPPLTAVAGISGRGANGFWFRAQANFAARQEDIPENALETPSWKTLDLYAGVRGRGNLKGHSLRVGIENALGEEYRDYLTSYRGAPFNEPGSSVSLNYEFIF